MLPSNLEGCRKGGGVTIRRMIEAIKAIKLINERQ